MDVNNAFKLMNFNAQSIRNKKQEFFSFLSRENIDICAMSETHLTDNDVCSHPDYFTYRLDRSDGRRGGGVALFVKRSIRHELLPCPNTKVIEAISIRVFLANSSIDVVATYFPGSNDASTIRDFKRDIITLLVPNRVILCGDLNSRHFSWTCSRNNAAGVALRQILDNEDILVHYPNSPTHFPHNGNLPSVIDLMLSKGIANHVETEVNHSFTSDHVPILYFIDLKLERAPDQTKLIRDFSRANWTLFRNMIESKVRSIRLPTDEVIMTNDEIDEKLEAFSQCILDADNASVPRKRVTPSAIHLTDEVKALIGLRKAKIRLCRRSNDPMLKPVIKLLTDRIEFLLKRQTNKRFENVVQSLNSNPGPNRKKFWRLTKILKNRPKQIPNLKVNDQKLITDSDKSEALADHFHALQRETDASLGSDSISRTIKSSLKFVEESQIDADTIPIISPAEVKSLISNLRNTKSPGLDAIENRHLKCLPPNAVDFLTEVLNVCLRVGYFPNIWKVAKIKCICKPGKVPTAVESYRPISLLSSISKIFEKLLKNRINTFLEDNEVIGNHQFGFRPGKSCTHQLLRIKNLIQTQLTAKKTTGMLSVDLKAAFESLWHDGLIHKLKVLNFPLYLIKVIQSFLRDRKFMVLVGTHISTERTVEGGAPQGAVLSPDLFNIFLHDIPTKFEATLAQFADDTAVIASSHKTSAVINKLQKSSDSLCRYFRKWRIRTNDRKSEATLFTRKTAARHTPNDAVRVDGGEVPWKAQLKYLGLILDPKLKFKEHIDTVLLKAEKLIRALYPLIHRHSRLSVQNKVLLYKTIFRPTLLYASPVWMNCANTHRKRIQVFQNKVLKIILNKPKRTPTVDIHELANVETIQVYMDKLNANFIRNCQNSINSDINLLVQ